jgi:sugar phosphate permease
MAITSGVWYTASVFFVALVHSFGWDYASTASIFSLFTVLYGIAGALSGFLADRIGPRRTILMGGALLAVALMANGLATARWHLYLTHSALAALGLAGMGWVPVSILLARGFDRRRGLAVGLASAGVGVGILVFVPLTQAMIDWASWRTAYIALGAISAAVVLPVGLFGVGEGRARATGFAEPEKLQEAQRLVDGAPGWTLAWALRHREFWLVSLTFVFLNSPVQLILTHQVAYLVEAGKPKAFAAGIVGLVGLLSVPGKILWGYLSDRWWIEATYVGGIAFLVAGVLTLLSIGPHTGAWALYCYAALMGIGYAVSPAMTPVLGARFFAGRHFGAIFGALNLLHHVGGALGVWLAGVVHDLTGTYTVAFLLSMASSLLSLACVWLAAPRRARP